MILKDVKIIKEQGHTHGKCPTTCHDDGTHSQERRRMQQHLIKLAAVVEKISRNSSIHPSTSLRLIFFPQDIRPVLPLTSCRSRLASDNKRLLAIDVSWSKIHCPHLRIGEILGHLFNHSVIESMGYRSWREKLWFLSSAHHREKALEDKEAS